MRPMPGGRAPMLEAFAKLGPIIAFAVFVVVVAALAVNFIQERLHPEANSRRFDATRNINRISSRGMVDLMFRKTNEER